MPIEKIITEQDFFECSGGMMPSPFQSRQLRVSHKSGDKFITFDDVSTISWVDFGCKKVMLLYAVVAAVAALVAALCVATGGAALIAICAIAGLAGAALGAIVGTLICGQLVAPTRKWLGKKSDFEIIGIKTINGTNYMQCNAFVMLGMNPELIKYNPNIRSWGQALAKGGANLLQNLFEGMMAGALIGTAGAAVSGLASMSASSFTWGNLGRGALQLGKNFLVNFAESFSTFGLGMRGVAGTQNVLATYGETGEMDAQTFDKAFSDGFWSPETGAVQSAQNIVSGQGTWQDYGGMILMFSPVGEGKRQVLDGEQPRVTVDADGLGRNADASPTKVDGDDTPAKPKSADADIEPAKPSEDGVPLQKGKGKTSEQVLQEQKITDVENGTTLLKDYGEKKGNYTRKGNYGEMKTDVHMEGITKLNGKDVEIQRISDDRVVDVDQKGRQGIDGVYENSNPPPQYIIVESKYGSSDLNPNTKDGPQMSDPWIENRLEDAVGKNKADDITSSGYERVLSQVDENGNVTTSRIDSNGNVIGTWP
jgi:hypothetical protein